MTIPAMYQEGMTRDELSEAIKALGLTKADFAREVARLSGLSVNPSTISRMTSHSLSGRDPSILVRSIARLMLEQMEAQKLRRAVERAGFKRER